MKNFDSRTYSINDFREWDERKQLELAPKFQRRSIWKDKAKSYLMDSIIRGKPIPKIFIRQIINPQTRKTIREVVDGQQRLRTILSYLQDGFPINRIHNSDHGGLVFSELPTDIQKAILGYEIATDLLLDARNEDILDIFGRLNSYSVTLSNQERLHANYFGEFRQMAYQLALEYLSFWTENKILSDQKILRMAEAELTSELLIAISVGIQSKKSIEVYYKKYDAAFPSAAKRANRFRSTMDFIGELMGDTLASSNFRRVHMFYTLFCSCYHELYGLPKVTWPRKTIHKANYPKVSVALQKIDEIFEKEEKDRTVSERKFLEAARRATTDAPVRMLRSKYVCDLINKAL